MLFSTQLLTNIQSINTTETIDKSFNNNISFFIESLEYILREDNNFHISLIKENYINEGLIGNYISRSIKTQLSKLNPKNIITKLIEGFISILEKIWNRFEALCMNLVSKHTNIKKYVSKLESLNIPIYYNEPRYIYSNIRDDNSYTSFKSELLTDYKVFIDNLIDLKQLNYDQISNKLNKIQNTIIDKDNFYDSLRAKTLGKQSPCCSDNYATELFNYYRSSGVLIDEGNIMPSEIKSRLLAWNNFSSTIKMIKKYKSDIKTTCNELKSNLYKLDLNSYINNNINEEGVNFLQQIINEYIDKIKNTCNIYLYYFTARLDAAKEEYASNTKILFVAAQTIVREGL